MSIPVFIHVMSNGDIWVSNNDADTPSGTVTATFRINSDAKFQKIGTLSGTASSNLSAVGATGKHGKELA